MYIYDCEAGKVVYSAREAAEWHVRGKKTSSCAAVHGVADSRVPVTNRWLCNNYDTVQSSTSSVHIRNSNSQQLHAAV